MVGFRALGGVAVTDGDDELPIGGARQRRLLAVLLIHHGTVVSVDRLVDAVFDGEPTPAATTTLRSYIARIRRVAAADGTSPVVVTRAPGYMLSVPDGGFDVDRFEAMVAAARTTGLGDPGAAASQLRAALRLWRGDAYAEFADREWARPESQRLGEARLAALESLYDLELARGGAAEVVAELEAAAGEHPLRERFRAQAMLALYRTGRQADALRGYQVHREVLADELGLDPTPELQALEARILAQDRTLADGGTAERELRGYRLGARLGRGPNGMVVAASMPGLDVDLEVRVVPAAVADDPRFVRVAEATARRVGALRHPAVVPIHDFWREPGGAFVVTPRAHGGTLADRLRRGPLTDAETAALVRRIGGALVVAAEQGVAHGRVDADSVVYDVAAEPSLTDFDLGELPGPTSPEADVVAFARLVAAATADADVAARLAALGAGPRGAVPLGELIDDLLDALGAGAEDGVERANPYLGLRAFDETDADRFFGRAAATGEVVARLARPGAAGRLVLVVGGSGSGKSSLVRAGVVPRLRAGGVAGSDRWLVVTLLPGAAPMKELAVALRRVAVQGRVPSAEELAGGIGPVLDDVLPAGAELLLVVDQLEELFTLASEADRRAFLDGVAEAVAAPGSRLRVLATLRADFYDRPLEVPSFGALVGGATVALAAMAPAEVEEAVVEPAAAAGRRVERALVADLVAAVATEPAALPSLQFALWELAASGVPVITAAAYRDLGGVSGAIASRAERVYAALDDDARAAVRRLFEHLVVVAGDGEPTRRVARRSELGTDPLTDPLVDRWVDARLLALDRDPHSRVPTVEVVHEALLREWPRLRGWIEEDRGRLVALGQLREAADGWLADHRDPAALARGARLQVALDAVGDRTDELAPGTRAFLEASRVARDAEAAASVEAAARQVRANRRLRVQLAVIAVALVMALVGGIVALDQRGRAESERQIAVGRELAAASGAAGGADPELATLLALEAIDATRDASGGPLPEAVAALHGAVAANRLLLSVPGVGGALDWSPAGDVFVTEGPEESGIVDVRDADTGASVRAFTGHDVDVNDVAFGPDGSTFATAGDDGALRVWATATGDLVHELVIGDGEVWGPSFSPDGARVAATYFDGSGPALVVVADVASGDEVWRTRAPGSPIATAFAPDGSALAIGDNSGDGAVVLDAATGAVRVGIGQGQLGVKDVAYSPDGAWVATGGIDGRVGIWDPVTGARVSAFPAHDGLVQSVDWSSDGTELATAGNDGKARVFVVDGDGIATARVTVGAHGTQSGIAAVAFSPDGGRIMTGDFAIEATTVWDVRSTGGGELPSVQALPDSWEPFEALADGTLVAPAPAGGVGVWDGDGNPIRTLGVDLGPQPVVAASPDGSVVASSSGEAPVHIWDVASGEEIGRWDPAGGAWQPALAWSPDGEALAIAYDAGGAGILVVERTGAEVARLPGEPGRWFVDVAFDAAGERLFAVRTGERNERDLAGTTVWDWRAERLLFELDRPASSIGVDPGGRRAATIRPLEPIVDVWSAETGDHELSIRSPAQANAVAFAPDGASIATAGADGTVRLWDLTTGTQVVALPHGAEVVSVGFAPDEPRLVSSGVDGTLRVWTLDLDELVDLARDRLTRSLTDDECRQFLHLERCRAS